MMTSSLSQTVLAYQAAKRQLYAGLAHALEERQGFDQPHIWTALDRLMERNLSSRSAPQRPIYKKRPVVLKFSVVLATLRGAYGPSDAHGLFFELIGSGVPEDILVATGATQSWWLTRDAEIEAALRASH